MNIKPKDGKFFSYNELGELINKTIDDVMSRNDNMAFNIKCHDQKIEFGSIIQLKKYRSIDGSDYLLLDVTHIRPKISFSNIKGGPIVLDYPSSKISTAAESIITAILSTQEMAESFNDTMELTTEVVEVAADYIINKGVISDILTIPQQLYDMIQKFNSRYIELEFILKNSDKRYRLYVYTTRDMNINVNIYIVNTIGTLEAAVVSNKSDFVNVVEMNINNIYNCIKAVASTLEIKPAVKVEYSSIS